jgi:hypothetical protein
MAMDGQVSSRLREALERLDQAIDMLDSQVAARIAALDREPDEAVVNAVIVERLDRIIERIEMALAD